MDRTLRVLGKDTVWLILDELSHGNKTPTELAKKFNMSVANVNNFLERLEDKRIVKRAGKISKGRGRPFTEYSLDQGPIFIYIPSEGKRYYIEYDEDAVNEIKKIIKSKKGGAV